MAKRFLKTIIETKIPGVQVYWHRVNRDERGLSAELFRSDDPAYMQTNIEMGYLSITEQGVIRGPHEHKKQTDRFVFTGPGDLELWLWDNRVEFPLETLEVLHVGEHKPCTVIVPPGVVHGYKNISPYRAVVLNFPNKLYKGRRYKFQADEIKHEFNSDSQFTIK